MWINPPQKIVPSQPGTCAIEEQNQLNLHFKVRPRVSVVVSIVPTRFTFPNEMTLNQKAQLTSSEPAEAAHFLKFKSKVFLCLIQPTNSVNTAPVSVYFPLKETCCSASDEKSNIDQTVNSSESLEV